MSEDLSVEILEALPTEEQRSEFLKFADLMRLLGDCVIDEDYVIPDSMNAAIHLTPAGEAIFHKVVMAKSDRIPAKEARLLCALAIGQEDLFIDLEKTDVDVLAKSIGEQVIAEKIRFPFTFGRAAYDAYAELFDEGQPVLTHAETLRFLEATPKGVQQYGIYVVGPYGLLKAESSRQLSSGRRIEAFHCSDTMCEVVHETHLATGDKAPINLHREKFNSALSAEKSSTGGWLGAAAEIRDLPSVVFSDVHVGIVAHLLGDALDDEELKELVTFLFDHTQGELRSSFRQVEEVGDAVEYVADLNRSQLLQIALLAREPWLRTALDALVEEGKIVIPSGEVRRPVVNAERRSGAFELSPELGSYGVRFTSPANGFAMLRMRHELRTLTSNADVDEVEELAWQIRHVDGETLEERLDTFFRETEPAECIERLVLPRKSHVVRLAD